MIHISVFYHRYISRSKLRTSLAMYKVKFFLSAFLIMTSSSALACTCSKINADSVAYANDIVLTKLKVSTPSITEWVRSFVPPKSSSRIYSVQVIENYKGEFSASTISVATYVGGGCGVVVNYGDILNVVAYKDSEGVTSTSVGICNVVSDEFAEKVRKEIKTPNEVYKSVDTNSWFQFHKSIAQTFYADTKHVTKDEYGSYIWVLLNDTSENVKSQKTRLKISCKEKMFTVDHEVSFSEYNANGKVLNVSNFGNEKQYQWLPLTDLYSKLLAHTC